ncbi:tumor necrosis factor receptor superfamily member 1B isoform X2 [Enhydra lutris kenyoni]|uniref:Tumor necrosis factor receptor superfamily member 1B isoform X2 n=1 Tax=Enhydra lutris kenyoni TaxID=391180 RepID=A0A2Y9KAN8_ENHLU|nr:tumor necrosis factor receptor superfamily member 1B isoform X2 [Enhydra lutris kenyoni]
MAPAAVWAALAVGLQLWGAGHAVPVQVPSLPYAPEPGSNCGHREYFNKRARMCCSKCAPGFHVRSFCTDTSDTVCARCENSTYTQLWNWVPECLSCDSRCSADQVETQACTREQNRICTCRPGSYCTLRRQEGCRLCAPLSRCRPGFGVDTPGTDTSDVVCTPCAPGTFSNTTSSTDTCRPHQICSSVAIPGNASMDAVCTSVPPSLGMATPPASTSQPGPTRSQRTEPTPGPSSAPSTSVLLPMVPSPPTEGLSTGDISLPIGLIVGVTAVGLLMIGLVNCVIVTQKKKRPFCLQGEAKVPHLPADNARGTQGAEQQHLLTTAPSSSSSSLESSASTADRGTPAPTPPQAPGAEKANGSREARAGSGSSAETSSGGHGTQVNVTCIVNVCSGSDHASQCASQASYTKGDVGASPSVSPDDEQVPFSKEECPFQSQPEAPETLLASPEDKPLPLGVPDAGMKPS